MALKLLYDGPACVHLLMQDDNLAPCGLLQNADNVVQGRVVAAVHDKDWAIKSCRLYTHATLPFGFRHVLIPLDLVKKILPNHAILIRIVIPYATVWSLREEG